MDIEEINKFLQKRKYLNEQTEEIFYFDVNTLYIQTQEVSKYEVRAFDNQFKIIFQKIPFDEVNDIIVLPKELNGKCLLFNVSKRNYKKYCILKEIE
jgi:hypothetical protein